MAEDEGAVEEEEVYPLSDISRKWDRIHHHHPHLWRSYSDSHKPLFDDNHNRSVVFPPSNHEGLHNRPPNTRCDLDNLASTPPSDGGSNDACQAASSWVGLGYGLVRARVLRVASCIRYLGALRGAKWSSVSATGVAATAACLIWWFYVAVRRRKRQLRVQEDGRDHLILLIKEKDEKIKRLLHQIAEMNQLLIALHRKSSSQGGVKY